MQAEKLIKQELLRQIQQYLDGQISKELYYEIAHDYFEMYAEIIKGTDFYNVFLNYIPDACLIYIDEPGHVEDKDKLFKETLEEANLLLRKLL
jgi:hypothetical protein